MLLKFKIKLFVYLILQDVVNIFSDFYISNRLRYVFYKIYLKKIGKKVIINAKTHIEVPEKVEIGSYCSINRDCWFSGGGGLFIGNDVLIGPKVIIHTANHNFTNTELPFRLQGHTHKQVTIKNNLG